MINVPTLERTTVLASVFAIVLCFAQSMLAQAVPPAPPSGPSNTQLETATDGAPGSWEPFNPGKAGSFLVDPGGVKTGVGSDENGTFNYLWWTAGDKKYRLRESDSPFYQDLALAEEHDKKIQINYDATGNVTSTWLF